MSSFPPPINSTVETLMFPTATAQHMHALVNPCVNPLPLAPEVKNIIKTCAHALIDTYADDHVKIKASFALSIHTVALCPFPIISVAPSSGGAETGGARLLKEATAAPAASNYMERFAHNMMKWSIVVTGEKLMEEFVPAGSPAWLTDQVTSELFPNAKHDGADALVKKVFAFDTSLKQSPKNGAGEVSNEHLRHVLLHQEGTHCSDSYTQAADALRRLYGQDILSKLQTSRADTLKSCKSIASNATKFAVPLVLSKSVLNSSLRSANLWKDVQNSIQRRALLSRDLPCPFVMATAREYSHIAHTPWVSVSIIANDGSRYSLLGGGSGSGGASDEWGRDFQTFMDSSADRGMAMMNGLVRDRDNFQTLRNLLQFEYDVLTAWGVPVERIKFRNPLPWNCNRIVKSVTLRDGHTLYNPNYDEPLCVIS